MRSAKLRGALIHQFRKGFDISADIMCYRYGGIIAARNHQTVQQILKSQLVAGLQVRHGGTGNRDF